MPNTKVSLCDKCKGCPEANKLTIEEEYEAVITECSDYKKQ